MDCDVLNDTQLHASVLLAGSCACGSSFAAPNAACENFINRRFSTMPSRSLLNTSDLVKGTCACVCVCVRAHATIGKTQPQINEMKNTIPIPTQPHWKTIQQETIQ
jgi:hypothetical protein